MLSGAYHPPWSPLLTHSGCGTTNAGGDSTGAGRGGTRQGNTKRTGGFIIRGLVALATAATVVALSATAAQGQDFASASPRWDTATLTVHIADKAAWSGTDVRAALAQWSPAMSLVLTDATDADIVLDAGDARTQEVGATAHVATEGSTITSCTVTLAQHFAGKGMTDVLTHELGHCLGLGHSVSGPSVMMWTDMDKGFSKTVTPADLASVRALYR